MTYDDLKIGEKFSFDVTYNSKIYIKCRPFFVTRYNKNITFMSTFDPIEIGWFDPIENEYSLPVYICD